MASLAELPVVEIASATHMLADLTLGLGTIVHDYMAEGTRLRFRLATRTQYVLE